MKVEVLSDEHLGRIMQVCFHAQAQVHATPILNSIDVLEPSYDHMQLGRSSKGKALHVELDASKKI